MNLPPVRSTTDPTSNNDIISIIEPLCAVFRRKLKSEGLKYTPERAHILDAVIRRESVFEADQLMESMRKGGYRVSKATVYRTIKLLAEAGIIQQVLFDNDQSHYQLAYGRSASALLVNVDTRAISSVEIPELAILRDRVCREAGLIPEGTRLVIYARNPESTVHPTAHVAR